ncbi:hypothetical protein KC355_g48 [Hortaea werneckii]|nr:hypothetical protein KC355_g48 [Hortaea werneckii]
MPKVRPEVIDSPPKCMRATVRLSRKAGSDEEMITRLRSTAEIARSSAQDRVAARECHEVPSRSHLASPPVLSDSRNAPPSR